MRVYKNADGTGKVINTYSKSGQAFKVTWEYGALGRYVVNLFYRKSKRGEWVHVYDSWFRLGAAMGEAYIPENAVACALYPGLDENDHELSHPGKEYPGLIDALEIANDDLREKLEGSC